MCEMSNSSTWLSMASCLLLLASTTFAGQIVYVDIDAIGANDGSSWADAYKYLQDALADANSVEKPVEIYVAQGIYRPDRTATEPNGTGDRTATFQLINGVTLKGGYAGFGEPDPNARNIKAYETILNGDLAGNDVDVNYPRDLEDETTHNENSYHVVTGSGADETAVLDGFTISKGNANGNGLSAIGAGMYNDAGSPTLNYCAFTENLSSQRGGGMSNIWESNPNLVNCRFSRNWADWDGGGMYNWQSSPILTHCTFISNLGNGGGMANFWDSSPALKNCTFNDNRSAGMYNSQSSPVLTNCTFSSNMAGYHGGGMDNRNSNPILTDCTFIENWSLDGAGGMNNDRSSPILRNCTFSKNEGDYLAGAMVNYESNPILSNCTFSENEGHFFGGGMYNYQSNPTLTNCTFSENVASCAFTDSFPSGGGMYNESLSSPTLTSCTFSGNQATDYGGGMFNQHKSYPILVNCVFTGNSAGFSGGGMHSYHFGNAMLTSCTFSGNFARSRGAGISCEGSDLILTNCIFSGNKVSYSSTSTNPPPWANSGSAIFCADSNLTLSNCTFGGNYVLQQGVLCNIRGSTVTMTNCILWNSGNEIFNAGGSITNIACSDVQGGWPGEGNIDDDPCFADPGYWADANDPNVSVEPNDPNAVWIDGDYHLKSQAGRWDVESKRWVQDDVTSPCIDAGDPVSAISLEPFPNGGVVNMGAHGGTAEASKSYFGDPVCKTIVAGDINGDCRVDFSDVALMAAHWLVDN